jgi:hypothetical protein
MKPSKSDRRRKSAKSIPGQKEVSGKTFEAAFLPWTAVLILAHLCTVYLGSAYMWGVHFYHFFPVWIGWALTLFSLALLAPPVAQLLYGPLEKIARKIGTPFAKWGENKTFFLLSVISLPIFWLFRDRLHLLGDGMFRITDLPHGNIHLQEWLDGFIHVIVFRVMHSLFSGWTPELTYAVISVLSGGAYVFLALKLSSLLGKTGFGKVLIFSFLITLGSVQLFFGYVESYTILQVALLAYVLLAARYLSGKTSILPVLVAFMISVALHITSLIYVPSFIYLLRKRRKGEPAGEKALGKTVSNAFVLAALIVASFLVISWVIVVAIGLERTGKGIFILPPFATETYGFGMFSLGHISEFVNQLLLLTPLGISLMLFFLFFKLKHREFKNRLINFLILAACVALVYLFVFNFTLGSADWDLRSSPAVFFGLLGVLSFLDWGEKKYARKTAPPEGERSESRGDSASGSFGWRRYPAWGLIFIWLGLFHTVPWILINSSEPKSVARYVLIQENDPHPVDETGYNLYKIARILKWADRHWEVVWMYQRAVEKDPYDTLSYYNLASQYHKLQELDSAFVALDTLFKIDPTYPKGNWMMGNILRRRGDVAGALPYLERAYEYLQDNVDFLYELGVAYMKTNQMVAAGGCGMQILKLKPDHVDAHYLLGAAYFATGDIENARKSWEYILAVNPDDSIAVDNLRILEERYEGKRGP